MVLLQSGVGAQVSEAVGQVAAFIPKLLGFLAILVIGYFVAKVIAKAVDKVLERVGFDGAVERGGVKKALSRSRYDASDLLAKLTFYAAMLFVLQLAFGVWGDNPISQLIYGVIAYLPRIFVAIVIVVVASAIAAAVREIVDASLGGLSYGSVLAAVASGAILVIGLFAALGQLQIAPAIINGLFYALLAIVAGSAIIAIGGGGVAPMRAQWEKALNRVSEEAPKVRQQAQGSEQRVQQRAQERKQQARGGPQRDDQRRARGDQRRTGDDQRPTRDEQRPNGDEEYRTIEIPADEPAGAERSRRRPRDTRR